MLNVRHALFIAWAVIGVAGAPAGAQVVIERGVAFDRDGQLRIMVMQGAVRVSGWDRDSVHVRASLDERAQRGFYFSASRGVGKMGIEGDGASAELTVRLPRGATVWIKTASAPIQVAEIDGGLDLYAVTGSITVDASPRSFYAESMGGAVTLHGSPRTARIKAGAGDVEVRGAVADLTVNNVTGAVIVIGQGTFRRAMVETVSGAVSMDGALERGSTIAVQTHDGPIDLAFPLRTNAEFVVATVDGEVRNELTPSASRKTRGLKGREITFSSGTGGAEVTVRTFSGRVTVRPSTGR